MSLLAPEPAPHGSTQYRARVLGCGSSGGVPRLGGVDGRGDWGACDPAEPRNRRSRCSLLVERRHPDTGYDMRDETTAVLFDTSPDMRCQLLAAGMGRLDAVFISHDHADQTHGIDDLRAIAIRTRRQLPIYLHSSTSGRLLDRFRYCFEQDAGSLYPAILEPRMIAAPGIAYGVDGPSGRIEVMSFIQRHGPVDALGFRVGDLAYSSDVNGVPEESWRLLEGAKIWIVDALQMKPHGTHAHLDQTLRWIERLRPERAILTNLHVSMDYATLIDILPPGVEPAYDGLEIEF